MNVTVNRPGAMKVQPNHTQGGKTLVYLGDEEDDRAAALWVSPETAAQWIEALTPLAEANQ